jgi:hypothetical protein
MTPQEKLTLVVSAFVVSVLIALWFTTRNHTLD